VSIKTGVVSQPIKIDHHISIHDTTNCATFTELIVTNPIKPYVIGTKMLFTGNQITAIESIATHPGDWAFNATGYLHSSSLENWEPIPAVKQDSRAVIQAAGDVYLAVSATSTSLFPGERLVLVLKAVLTEELIT
jgi:hypothetical protein